MDKFTTYVMGDISGFLIALFGALCIFLLGLGCIFCRAYELEKYEKTRILFCMSGLVLVTAMGYKIWEML